MPVSIFPVTSDRWPDLEALFGPKGAYAGCWCMFWRLDKAQYKQAGREGRREGLKALALQGRVPGLLAYVDGQPAGWVSLGPRQDYPFLEASRLLKRVDDLPVWAIVCFFIARPYRKQGLMLALLQGALAYACQQGAVALEGYPTDLQSPRLAGQPLRGCTGYMGIASAYREAGFIQVGQVSETQLVMRYTFQESGNR